MNSFRIQAFDDGYFPVQYKGCRGKTIITGVETKGFQINKVCWKPVTVDGRETSSVVIELSKLMGSPDLLILDGITYAGFDTADPDEIYLNTNTPVVVVQQYPLDLDNIREALYRNFSDADERYSVIKKVVDKFQYLDTPWKTIQFYATGIELDKARIILLKTMIYSPIPEPLRIAHSIASILSRRLFSVVID
uniref:UPF0215 protein ENT92_00410 n=1 Tax=Staphylothermus marinus TaxID=2280 RepID=A0A7C4D6Y1_STAMA